MRTRNLAFVFGFRVTSNSTAAEPTQGAKWSVAEQLYTFEFSSRKNMMGVRTKRFAVIRNHGERAHQEGEVTEAAHLTTTKSEDGQVRTEARAGSLSHRPA